MTSDQIKELAPKIADSYCKLVANWGYHYHPEDMEAMYSAKPITRPSIDHEFVPSPDDMCDGNEAMAGAFDENGIDTDAIFNRPEHEAEGYPQWFEDLWNKAYDIARANGWFPVATLDGEGPSYMAVWGLGYIKEEVAVVSIEHFDPAIGYDPDDIAQLARLGVGKCANLSGVTDEYYVWRIR